MHDVDGAILQTVGTDIAKIRPDGVLVGIFWPSATRRGIEQRLVVVNISDFVRTTLPTVRIDQHRVGVLAAEHLLAQGLPLYAFAAVAGRGYGAELRWRGFRAAHSNAASNATWTTACTMKSC